MPRRFDISDDAWLNLHRAERILGRPLAPDEEADVRQHGFRAECVRDHPRLTSDPLTRDEELVLCLTERLGDEASWYNVGRFGLGQMENPGDFSQIFPRLVARGLLTERSTDKMEWYKLTDVATAELAGRAESDGSEPPNGST
jgi:hypothetical protein